MIPTPAGPAATPPVTSATKISFADFQKLALRIGVIREAADHPNADRLLVLQVELGGDPPERRQVVAGIKPHYAPADLIGRAVIVVTNLEPATIRGVESQGMVLAASHEHTMTLMVPDRPLPPGSIVK